MDIVTVVKPSWILLTPLEWIREAEHFLEQCGRVCYKSEDKIGADTAGEFIRRLVKSGHESVIEHFSITVKIICDRSCSHQLVRHRLAAYSQESQRYCDYGKLGFQVVCPPSVAHIPCDSWACKEGVWTNVENELLHLPSDEYVRAAIWLQRMLSGYGAYCDLRRSGVKPEDARSVLPNATKTEVVTTYNLRQWRHVFQERALNSHAQWQIREIMIKILASFAGMLPGVFIDQWEEIQGTLTKEG